MSTTCPFSPHGVAKRWPRIPSNFLRESPESLPQSSTASLEVPRHYLRWIGPEKGRRAARPPLWNPLPLGVGLSANPPRGAAGVAKFPYSFLGVKFLPPWEGPPLPLGAWNLLAPGRNPPRFWPREIEAVYARASDASVECETFLASAISITGSPISRGCSKTGWIRASSVHLTGISLSSVLRYPSL